MAQINFPSTESSNNLNVRSNSTWTVTLQDLGDGVSIVKINDVVLGTGTYQGSGDEDVKITFLLNSTGANRTVQVTVTSDTAQVFTLFQSKSTLVNRVFAVNASNYDAGKIATQKYNFTSNTTGSDIEFTDTIITSGQPSEFVVFSDYEGLESIPVDGDTVDLKANRIGSATVQPFIPELGNTMGYLITDTVYDPNDSADFQSGLTKATVPTATLAGDVYTSQFTYTRASKSYLYLFYDYQSQLTANGNTAIVPAGSSNGATINVKINFSNRIGRATIGYDANTTSKTFILKLNDVELFNSGSVTGAGTISFLKGTRGSSNSIYDLQVLTGASDDGWEITPNATTLTSFLIENTGTTLASVCSDTAADTAYHTGINALPEVGDNIYTNTSGTIAFDGNDQYFKISTNNYALITATGLVVDTGDCSPCSETAVPVISSTSFTFEPNQRIGFDLITTNNPEYYSLVSACNNYLLTSGDSGSTFTVVDCTTGITKSVTVMSGSSLEICSSSTPVLVSGNGTTTSKGVCSDEILPPGILFNEDTGSFSGNSSIPGTYSVVVTATNCFGTSVNTTINLIINPVITLIRYNMDISNPQVTSTLACGVTPSYAQMYHSGKGTYPALNDFIYTFVNGRQVAYNGGYKYYITDELTGGKNNIIRIDGVGQVVEKTVCP